MATTWPSTTALATTALDADTDTTTGASGARAQLYNAVVRLNAVLGAVNSGATVYTSSNPPPAVSSGGILTGWAEGLLSGTEYSSFTGQYLVGQARIDVETPASVNGTLQNFYVNVPAGYNTTTGSTSVRLYRNGTIIATLTIGAGLSGVFSLALGTSPTHDVSIGDLLATGIVVSGAGTILLMHYSVLLS